MTVLKTELGWTTVKTAVWWTLFVYLGRFVLAWDSIRMYAFVFAVMILRLLYPNTKRTVDGEPSYLQLRRISSYLFNEEIHLCYVRTQCVPRSKHSPLQ